MAISIYLCVPQVSCVVVHTSHSIPPASYMIGQCICNHGDEYAYLAFFSDSDTASDNCTNNRVKFKTYVSKLLRMYTYMHDYMYHYYTIIVKTCHFTSQNIHKHISTIMYRHMNDVHVHVCTH